MFKNGVAVSSQPDDSFDDELETIPSLTIAHNGGIVENRSSSPRI